MCLGALPAGDLPDGRMLWEHGGTYPLAALVYPLLLSAVGGLLKRAHSTGQALSLLLVALAAWPATATTEAERRAREHLAKKLLKLSQHFNMREGSFSESITQASDINENDLNPMPADTTFHSQVFHYCARWLFQTQMYGRCQKWIPPYVSVHGYTSEQSPLERKVAELYEASVPKNPDAQVPSGQYAIWRIERKDGGGILDADGKIEREGIRRWELTAAAKAEIDRIGVATAERTIDTTYDDGTDRRTTLPNMEGLRLMAQRWTKMMRNRAVAVAGDLRAMDKGVEIGLDQQFPECEDYPRAMAAEPEETYVQQRRNPQELLSVEAMGVDVRERIARCRQLRAMSVYAINPQIGANGKVESGAAENESFEKWRMRAQVAVIDSVGMDPNELPKPSDNEISEDEQKVTYKDFVDGGRTYSLGRRSNAESLESYNKQLDRAADGWTQVAVRTNLVDVSDKIRRFKIAPKSVDAVSLNGPTREMRNELSETGFPFREPASQLEDKPIDLTVRAAR